MNYDNYWFYLEPYVYTNIKGKHIFLFNTLDGEYITCENDEITNFITSVLSPSNCGVVLFKYDSNCPDELVSFVKEVRDKFMGDVIPVNLSLKKPVQPLPLVHIKQEFKKSAFLDSKVIQGTDILQYLTEISVYLNTSCEQNCKDCTKYHKQFLFCTQSKEVDDNEIDRLTNIVSLITKHNFCGQVNLLGGDFRWLLECAKEVASILSPIIDNCKVLCHQCALRNIISTNIFNKGQIKLLVDYPIQSEDFNYIKEQGIRDINVVIRNKEEYTFFESTFKNDPSLQVKYLPFYNGNNEGFFINHVFLNKEEILDSARDMQYIHQNMTLNMYSFGKLLIMPNGNVYSNINCTPIGNIKDENLLELIYNELTSPKSSWMKIRNKGKCRNCIFQYLCPPISNYEYAFKRFNTCNVNE